MDNENKNADVSPSTEPQSPATTAASEREKAHILVIDDSLTQVELLRFLLEDAGYRVSTALNGQQGLEVVRHHRPDLVISDIVMPVMNGYELCGTIKRDPDYRDIPVMLLTTLADVEDIIVGLEAKADYYVTKPYNEEFLLSRADQLVRHHIVPSLEENLDALEVTLAGKSYVVSAERRYMLNMLVSTYENAIQRNRELVETQRELKISNILLAEQTQKAQASEQNYRTVLENSIDAMLVVASDGRILFVNVATPALLGKDVSALVGSRFEFPLSVGMATEVQVGEESWGADGWGSDGWGGDASSTTPNGAGGARAGQTGRRQSGTQGDSQRTIAELRVVETTWEGAPAYLAILRDITERKHYEAQIQRHQHELHEVNLQLRALASIDVMTGLANLRSFQERLEVEVMRSIRYETSLSLIMLDLDSFKSYNDEFGHLAGNEALRTVANVLQKHVRTSDFVARYGGEEIVIIAPNTDAVGAIDLAQRLRVALERHEWPLRRITASFGVATVDETTRAGIDLLSEADKAMYQSKFSGRNRVTHAYDVVAASEEASDDPSASDARADEE